MREPRRPGLVGGIDVTGGVDTDADGRADTVVTGDGADLVLSTDLDGDGLADQVLHLGPDATVWVAPVWDTTVWAEVIAVVDRMLGGEPAG